MKWKLIISASCLFGLLAAAWAFKMPELTAMNEDRNRNEVVFWHFWGGPDRDVVESVVSRFNESQQTYFVRAVAMPGNNLQAKLFLSVAGGDPPDLVNQDDPILADWASRNVIQPLDQITSPRDVQSVRDSLLPAAERLSIYDDRMFAVCNGLDIRALYYNQTALTERGLTPPKTIAELDAIAASFSPNPESIHDLAGAKTFGYLPDSRRLWAWGIVFGGDFFQQQFVSLTAPEIVAALTWMVSYAKRFGPNRIATFRTGDQSLPGKMFPLLPVLDDQTTGRYVLLMDGQWRVRDIEMFQQQRRQRELPVPEFGVCPLPTPPGGLSNAGWVNGNFFVVPAGAKNGTGAWEFIKFWIGEIDSGQAAKTCAEGGWIPVRQTVIDDPVFQQFLDRQPLFRPFVELATSENQYPFPIVRGAAMFRRTVEDAAYQAMQHPEQSPLEILTAAEIRIQNQLDRLKK